MLQNKGFVRTVREVTRKLNPHQSSERTTEESNSECKCNIVGGGGGGVLAQLVEALRYKMEDGGFDSRYCHRNF